MPQAFNITARLQIEGPANLRPAVQQIKQQLGGIGANVQVQVSPASARGVANVNQTVQQLQANLQAVQTQARAVGTALGGVRGPQAATQQSAQLNRQLGSTIGTLQKVRNQISGAGTDAGRFGELTALAARRFAAYYLGVRVLLQVRAAFADATNEALNFQREMIRIGQVGGDSQTRIAGLAAEIGRLATTLGVPSRGLAEVATTLRQAGLSANDTQVALSALAKTQLAPTFKDINNTVEGSIALMQQFGIGAKGLEGALGAVNTVAAQFAVESDDLVTAIQKAGGAFKAASGDLVSPEQSFNQLLSVFTSVRQTTRESADEISTGLRTIFGRLQAPGVQKNLEDLGISLRFTAEEANLAGRNIEGQFVGAWEAVRRLSEATKNVPTTSPVFAQIATEIGGYRQVSRVIPLLQQFSVAQRAYSVAQSGSNSLTRDAAEAQAAWLVQMTKVREEFNQFVRNLSEDKGMRAFLTFALDATRALIGLADVLRPLIPLLLAFGTVKVAQQIGNFGRGVLGQGGLGVIRRQSGGVVPGSGTGDKVPASLRGGDFVIRRTSAQKIGYHNLAAKYQSGGRVNALLEPGEWLVPKEKAVGRYGELYKANATGRLPGYARGGYVQGLEAGGTLLVAPDIDILGEADAARMKLAERMSRRVKATRKIASVAANRDISLAELLTSQFGGGPKVGTSPVAPKFSGPEQAFYSRGGRVKKVAKKFVDAGSKVYEDFNTSAAGTIYNYQDVAGPLEIYQAAAMYGGEKAFKAVRQAIGFAGGGRVIPEEMIRQLRDIGIEIGDIDLDQYIKEFALTDKLTPIKHQPGKIHEPNIPHGQFIHGGGRRRVEVRPGERQSETLLHEATHALDLGAATRRGIPTKYASHQEGTPENEAALLAQAFLDPRELKPYEKYNRPIEHEALAKGAGAYVRYKQQQAAGGPIDPNLTTPHAQRFYQHYEENILGQARRVSPPPAGGLPSLPPPEPREIAEASTLFADVPVATPTPPPAPTPERAVPVRQGLRRSKPSEPTRQVEQEPPKAPVVPPQPANTRRAPKAPKAPANSQEPMYGRGSQLAKELGRPFAELRKEFPDLGTHAKNVTKTRAEEIKREIQARTVEEPATSIPDIPVPDKYQRQAEEIAKRRAQGETKTKPRRGGLSPESQRDIRIGQKRIKRAEKRLQDPDVQERLSQHKLREQASVEEAQERAKARLLREQEEKQATSDAVLKKDRPTKAQVIHERLLAEDPEYKAGYEKSFAERSARFEREQAKKPAQRKRMAKASSFQGLGLSKETTQALDPITRAARFSDRDIFEEEFEEARMTSVQLRADERQKRLAGERKIKKDYPDKPATQRTTARTITGLRELDLDNVSEPEGFSVQSRPVPQTSIRGRIQARKTGTTQTVQTVAAPVEAGAGTASYGPEIRPVKAAPRRKTAEGTPEHAATIATTEPPKRGRGRPRKDPNAPATPPTGGGGGRTRAPGGAPGGGDANVFKLILEQLRQINSHTGNTVQKLAQGVPAQGASPISGKAAKPAKKETRLQKYEKQIGELTKGQTFDSPDQRAKFIRDRLGNKEYDNYARESRKQVARDTAKLQRVPSPKINTDLYPRDEEATKQYRAAKKRGPLITAPIPLDDEKEPDGPLTYVGVRRLREGKKYQPETFDHTKEFGLGGPELPRGEIGSSRPTPPSEVRLPNPRAQRRRRDQEDLVRLGLADGPQTTDILDVADRQKAAVDALRPSRTSAPVFGNQSGGFTTRQLNKVTDRIVAERITTGQAGPDPKANLERARQDALNELDVRKSRYKTLDRHGNVVSRPDAPDEIFNAREARFEGVTREKRFTPERAALADERRQSRAGGGTGRIRSTGTIAEFLADVPDSDDRVRPIAPETPPAPPAARKRGKDDLRLRLRDKLLGRQVLVAEELQKLGDIERKRVMDEVENVLGRDSDLIASVRGGQADLLRTKSGNVIGAKKRVPTKQRKGFFSGITPAEEREGIISRVGGAVGDLIGAGLPAKPADGVRGAGRAIGGAIKGGAGKLAGPAGFALAFAPAIIDQVTGGFDPKTGRNRTSSGVGGGLGGAAIGAQIGSFVGPWGTAIGAAVGAIGGFITATQSADRQMREVKFQETWDKADQAIQGVLSGQQKIDATSIGKVNTGLQAFGERLRSEVPTLTQQDVSVFKDPKEAVSNFSHQVGLGGKALGGAFLDPILGTNFLGDATTEEENRKSGLAKQREQKRKDFVQQELAPQVPALRQFAETIARDTRVSPHLLATEEGGQPLSRDTIEQNRRDRLSEFERKGGLPIASKIAEAQGISLSEYLQQIDAAIVAANKERVAREANTKAVVHQTVQQQAFTRITDAMSAAANSIGDLESKATALQAAFDGTIRSIPVAGLAAGAANIGGIDDKSFNRTLSFVSNTVGGGKGTDPLVGQFARTAQGVNSVAQTLPGVIARAVSAGGTSEETLGGRIDLGLRESGIGDDIRGVLRSALDSMDPKALTEEAGQNAQKLSDDLIGKGFANVNDVLKNAAEMLERRANELGEGLAQNQEMINRIGQSQDKLSQLQVNAAQTRATAVAQAVGRPSQGGLSLETTLRPFQQRQERLTGLEGQQALDPALIGAKLRDTQQQAEQVRTLRDQAPDSRAQAGLSIELANLQGQSQRLGQALEGLADTSERTAAIQEKINKLEEDQQGRLSFTEKLLTADPRQRREIERGATAADAAVQQGSFAGFSSQNIQRALEHLSSLGNAQLQGYGGRTASDVRQQLLVNSGLQIGTLDPRRERDRIGLYQQQAGVAETAVGAQEQIVQNQQTLQQQFFTQLVTIQERFLAQLQTNLLEATKRDITTQQGQAGSEARKTSEAKATLGGFSQRGLTVDAARRLSGDQNLAGLEKTLRAQQTLPQDQQRLIDNLSQANLGAASGTLTTGQEGEITRRASQFLPGLTESEARLGITEKLNQRIQAAPGQALDPKQLQTELTGVISEFTKQRAQVTLPQERVRQEESLRQTAYGPGAVPENVRRFQVEQIRQVASDRTGFGKQIQSVEQFTSGDDILRRDAEAQARLASLGQQATRVDQQIAEARPTPPAPLSPGAVAPPTPEAGVPTTDVNLGEGRRAGPRDIRFRRGPTPTFAQVREANRPFDPTGFAPGEALAPAFRNEVNRPRLQPIIQPVVPPGIVNPGGPAAVPTFQAPQAVIPNLPPQLAQVRERAVAEVDDLRRSGRTDEATRREDQLRRADQIGVQRFGPQQQQQQGQPQGFDPRGLIDGFNIFAGASAPLVQALNNFGQVAQVLQNLNIPSQITLQSQNRVEVLINGAQVINAMTSGLREEVVSAVMQRLQVELPKMIANLPARIG